MAEGRIDYVELPSATAHELTRGFYAKAFGWGFTDYGPDYSATTNGHHRVGLNGQPDGALAAPLPVMRVDDLEAVFDAVVQGRRNDRQADLHAFPGGRRFHFIDPAGSELAVWQAARVNSLALREIRPIRFVLNGTARSSARRSRRADTESSQFAVSTLRSGRTDVRIDGA